MIELLHIRLEAHNEERNHHRSYELTVGRDLLGDWVVTLAYGRIGKGQQRRQFGTPDKEEAHSFVLSRLRRRISAPQRIGCSYAVTKFVNSSDAQTKDWLPTELIARLPRAWHECLLSHYLLPARRN